MNQLRQVQASIHMHPAQYSTVQRRGVSTHTTDTDSAIVSAQHVRPAYRGGLVQVGKRQAHDSEDLGRDRRIVERNGSEQVMAQILWRCVNRKLHNRQDHARDKAVSLTLLRSDLCRSRRSPPAAAPNMRYHLLSSRP